MSELIRLAIVGACAEEGVSVDTGGRIAEKLIGLTNDGIGIDTRSLIAPPPAALAAKPPPDALAAKPRPAALAAKPPGAALLPFPARQTAGERKRLAGPGREANPGDAASILAMVVDAGRAVKRSEIQAATGLPMARLTYLLRKMSRLGELMASGFLSQRVYGPAASDGVVAGAAGDKAIEASIETVTRYLRSRDFRVDRAPGGFNIDGKFCDAVTMLAKANRERSLTDLPAFELRAPA